MVKIRKIGGGTRSDVVCATFFSLKQTCSKPGIPFRQYLIDRILCNDQIALLHNIIEQRIATA
jgi:hypothetical protein